MEMNLLSNLTFLESTLEVKMTKTIELRIFWYKRIRVCTNTDIPLQKLHLIRCTFDIEIF